jgi:hypothetical protein
MVVVEGGKWWLAVPWLFRGRFALGFALLCLLWGLEPPVSLAAFGSLDTGSMRYQALLFGEGYGGSYDDAQGVSNRCSRRKGLARGFFFTLRLHLSGSHQPRRPHLASSTPTHPPTDPPHYISTGRKTDTPARGRDPWSSKVAWPSGVREPTSSLPYSSPYCSDRSKTQATTTS